MLRSVFCALTIAFAFPVFAADRDDEESPSALAKASKAAVSLPASDDDGLSSADDLLGGTEVYQTQEKGEFEIQADMFLGRNLQQYAGEIEYGITDEFMISFGTGYRRELESDDAGDAEEEGGAASPTSTWTGEVELRYRLPRQRAWPVDIAFSLDVAPQFVRGQATQWTTEPRLILQHTFGPLTATANLGAELGRYSSLELSGGLLYSLCRYAAVGGEVLYDSRDREISGIPQIFLMPTRQFTVVLGYTFCSDPALNTWDASLRFDF